MKSKITTKAAQVQASVWYPEAVKFSTEFNDPKKFMRFLIETANDLHNQKPSEKVGKTFDEPHWFVLQILEDFAIPWAINKGLNLVDTLVVSLEELDSAYGARGFQKYMGFALASVGESCKSEERCIDSAFDGILILKRINDMMREHSRFS